MASLSHRQGWSFAVLLTLFPCLFNASSTSDPPPATYRTGTSEVRVTFFATNENNRLVETVGKEDFAVVDSGLVIRDFRSLTRSDETPLDVVLLVDTSESVARHFQAASRDVLRLVSQNVLTPRDTMSVIAFHGLKPELLCSGDCSTPASDQTLLAEKSAGMTPLYDALDYTARFLSGRRTPGVQQVVILFSDGNDTISKTAPRDAVDTILATNSLIYTVNLGASANASGSALLRQMAEASGGRIFSMQEGAVNAMQCVFADLHASYVVTYRLPSRAAGFHSLRILPKHNLNLRFHCRRGYFYENQ